MELIADEMFKRWKESGRIDSIDVAVESRNKATIAHTEFAEIVIGI